MTENKKYRFEKLTPKKDIDNLEFYEEALDFALFDNDVRNVAITGIYGAGKSSILESYKNTKKSISKNQYLHISLANFKKTSTTPEQVSEGQQTDSNIENKILEGKILNQILHQIDPKMVPQSIFQLKRTIKWIDIIIPTLFIVLFIVNTWYLWGSSQEDSDYELNIILLIIQISIIVYNLVKMQLNKKIFKKLSIRSANVQSDIEVFKDSEESYFDKYLDDVIYLFSNTEAKVIVFEDIDRFDNNIIFAKLKEINTLVNNHKTAGDKITFIYMLRDDMFLSKDRTKFFDFIIPVIPFVNSSNSYDLLKEQLELQPNLSESDEENLFEKFNHYFLLKLSIYIDDMRLLLNIVNEFIVYYGRLNLLPIDVNKLFAIIVYKNVLPNDFAGLQINTGFVFQIFENKKEYTTSEREEIVVKIKELEREIEDHEMEFLKSSFELYSLYFKGKEGYVNYRVNGKEQSDYPNNSDFIQDIIEAEYQIEAQQIRYTNWYSIDLIDEFKEIESNYEFTQRLKNIQNKSRIKELKNEIKELENKIIKLKESRVYEVITRTDIENIENEHFTGELKEFEDIKKDSYFDLLVFLITNGYLDEEYHLYITYFHEKSLTITDQKFLKGIYDESYLDADYELTNLSEIYNRLENQDFLKIETLNKYLFIYILTTKKLKNRIDRLKNYYKIINDSNQIDFFMKVYFEQETDTNKRAEIKDEMLLQLSRYTPSLLKKLIGNDLIDKNNQITLIFDALSYFDKNLLKLFEEDKDILIDFISKSSSLLYRESLNQLNLEQFVENLKYWGVKFENIEFDKVKNPELRDNIFYESLYVINLHNISKALSFYYDEENIEEIKHRNYTLLSKRKESILSEYIENNLKIYLDVYIQFSEGVIKDGEQAIYSLINNDSLEENKRNDYINSLDEQKLLIDKLDDEKFYKQLITKNNLVPNTENILLYFKYAKNSWSEELIEFVNLNSEDLEFSWPVNKKDFDEDFKLLFFELTVIENELDNKTYKKIMESMYNNIKEGLPINAISIDKVKILIKINTLIFSKNNLNELRANYPELLMNFISENIILYLELVKDDNVYEHEEVINLLNYSKDSSVKTQRKIIDVIKKPITVVNKKYHTYVLNYILKTKFNNEDLDYVIQNYEKFGVSTQPLILEKVIEHINIILEHRINLIDSVLYALLYNNNISLENRRILFSRNIGKIGENYFKNIFIALELDDFIVVINENRRDYKFDVNEINNSILSDLEGRKLISSFEKKNNYYSVNSKKEKNLI